MGPYSLYVFSDAVPGKEDEYNRWYDDVHVPQVLTLPGVIGAERLRYATKVMGSESQHRYLTRYVWDVPNISIARGTLDSALTAGTFEMSDSIDMANVRAWFFEPTTGPSA